jgi:hypothetical protein
MRGDRDAVRAALAGKADADAPQVDGSTALHWAVEQDDHEMAATRAMLAITPRHANGKACHPEPAPTNSPAAMVGWPRKPERR